MAIVKVSKQDISRMKPPKKGWHLVRVIGDEDKISKDKQGINTIFELEVLEGDCKGQFAYAMNSSKAPGMCIVPLYCAAMGISVDQLPADGLEIDTEAIKGRTLHIEMDEEMFEGKMVSRVVSYLPANVKPAF